MTGFVLIIEYFLLFLFVLRKRLLFVTPKIRIFSMSAKIQGEDCKK